MPAQEKTLDDLFLHTLKDIYYAEKKILKSIPKMAKAADNEELKQAFEKHRGETQGQIERLEQVFELLGKRAQGATCEAINGILEGAKGSWTISARAKRSMPVFSRRPRRSSITRSYATAPSSPGRRSSERMTPPSFSARTCRKRRRPTSF
jgi:hypothetical protein